MPPLFRHNLEETREQDLALTIAALEQKPCVVPFEYMRAWLSHMTNGEFDAVYPEHRDH